MGYIDKEIITPLFNLGVGFVKGDGSLFINVLFTLHLERFNQMTKFIADINSFTQEDRNIINDVIRTIGKLAFEVFPEKFSANLISWIESETMDFLALPAAAQKTIASPLCFYIGFRAYSDFTGMLEEKNIRYSETDHINVLHFTYTHNEWDCYFTINEIVDTINEFLFDCKNTDDADIHSLIGAINCYMVKKDDETNPMIFDLVLNAARDKWQRLVSEKLNETTAKPVQEKKKSWISRLFN